MRSTDEGDELTQLRMERRKGGRNKLKAFKTQKLIGIWNIYE
jgi:hypothetical protein